VLAELEPIANSPGTFAFVVLLGLLWGSFANVCIYRLPPSEEHPKGRSVVAPGSHCFACKTPIRWYDNVPLLSYLWLRGQCRTCKAPFSSRYLLVEVATGALFGVAWWFTVSAQALWQPFDQRLIHFAIAAAFVFTMVVITFIDVDHKLILNKVTIPSMIVFYGLSLLLPERRWYDGLVGMAVGYGVPWLIGEIYYRVTKREGLGLGDGMLLAVVGALLGWRGVVVSLFGGSLIGSVIGIPLLISRRFGKQPEASNQEASILKLELPFGPFLAMAAVFYLFAEPWIALNFRLTGG
jgi:leader peptidase (prepilin peptidase)/N-methyltransferase